MRYSTVTSTGPRSLAMLCVVIGAGQCIDGERSMPAPVCSFQRQVSGMAATAPAAARKCAAGNPSHAATSPHTALPSVRQPKKTVVYKASPRPRTQSGSATCAETLSVASAAIHDAPAMSARGERHHRLAGEAVKHHRQRLAERSERHQAVRPQFRFQPRQEKRAADRADADDAEQHAVKAGSAGDLPAGDERQQRPIGAGEQKEPDRAHQRAAQVRIVPRVAKAGQHRLAETLRRQQRARAARFAPPQQRADNAEIGNGVEPERRDDAESGNHRAAERRADGARDVDADAVGGDGGGEIILGNELRHHGLPGRRRQCSGGAEHEREQQQIHRRGETKPHHRRIDRGQAPCTAISTTIKYLRLSKISASAPAGIANKQIGKELAACTSATINGSGLRLVMSQPEAALYIQPPTLETTVAVQITVNAVWRNGAANDAALVELALGGAHAAACRQSRHSRSCILSSHFYPRWARLDHANIGVARLRCEGGGNRVGSAAARV